MRDTLQRKMRKIMMCPFLDGGVNNAQRHREPPANALPEMARIAATKCAPMRVLNACKCKPSYSFFFAIQFRDSTVRAVVNARICLSVHFQKSWAAAKMSPRIQFR